MSIKYKKPSGLITIAHKLSAVEHKTYSYLLKLAIDKLAPLNEEEQANHNGVFDTTFNEIKTVMALTENRQVKSALDKLKDNGIKADNLVLKKGVEKWNVNTNFLAEWKHQREENLIVYQIPNSIMELLSEKYIFALIDLKTLSTLNNKHSLWLYEVITDYKNISTGSKTYTVDEIRYIAGLSATYKVGDLKYKILQKSVDEINEKTNLKVSLVVNKRGVKVVSFTFKFYDKEKDIGKLRYLFRMWLYHYYLDIEIASNKLQLSYYLSKDKKGNVLVYDMDTKKPIRKDMSFKVFDNLFEHRAKFFLTKFKTHFNTECESIEEELKEFEATKPFYIAHEDLEDLF